MYYKSAKAGMGKNVKIGLFMQLNYVHEQAAKKGNTEQKAKNNPEKQ